MRKKLNIAVTALLISALTTSGITTASQVVKVEAGTLDQRIKLHSVTTQKKQIDAKDEAIVDNGMVSEGSGDGHDVEIDPAEYYGYGYEKDNVTDTKEKKKKTDKKDKNGNKVKQGKKKKKKEKANKQKQAKKKAKEAKNKKTEKKAGNNNKNNKKYADENEAMRKSLLGVKGKVLARDDEYGAPLVIKQGDRLILSEWQKKLDAYHNIVRDAKGWRLYSPDRGICPDHAFDNKYDIYCEYRQEEIDKMIKWEKEHADE